MPLTEICNRTYRDPRQRQLFKNIIYIGALAFVLDMDITAVEKLIGEQYKAKEALIAPNHQALHLGYDYAKENLGGLCQLSVQPLDMVGNRIFVNGNDAAALGCLVPGAARQPDTDTDGPDFGHPLGEETKAVT